VSDAAVSDALTQRRSLLRTMGATEPQVDELLAYNANRFRCSPEWARSGQLADEPFVAAWEARLADAATGGVWTVLQHALPQLGFPIAAGMSTTAAYRRATRSGVFPASESEGVTMERPSAVALHLHATPAGRIPVIGTPCRADFETLVRALVHRNEPVPIAPSMGACMVSGHPNWTLLQSLRREWESASPSHRSDAAWRDALAGEPARERYRDRFILVSGGDYSGVPAHRLGLDDARWRALSLVIRTEHECAHYFTRRAFGAMTNALLDELIADYAGLVAALGYFRADWFLEFLGIGAGLPPDRGRLVNYRGTPPLSDGALELLTRLVVAAAEAVARFDRTLGTPRRETDRVSVIAALTTFSLEELAGADAIERLHGAFERQRDLVVAA
jgi:hypothetical protein